MALYMAAVEDAFDPTQPLINDGHESPSSTQPAELEIGPWRWFHTATILWVRTIISFVYYSPMVFWLNYEAQEGVTTWEYALILVCGEIGCAVAVFGADFTRNCLKSDENVIASYLPLCAAASIAYPAFAYFAVDQYANWDVAWCCSMRFVIGLSFAFICASSLKFAADHIDDSSRVTGTVAVLYFSWPISIALNVFAGYLLSDDSWMLVFVYSGCALIVSALYAKTIFKCFPIRRVHHLDRLEDENNTVDVGGSAALSVLSQSMLFLRQRRLSGLRSIFTDKKSVTIIVVSFFVTLRLCTMLIVFNSLWMETIYEMTASTLGWASLSIAFGEVVGLGLLRGLSHRFELWHSAVTVLTTQWLFGALIFAMSAGFGNDIPLAFSMTLVAFLWMGNATFRVIQKSNALHFAPSRRLKFNLLLAQRMAEEMAGIVAVAVTVKMWNYLQEDAILLFSVFWLGTNAMECFILFIYSSPPLDSGYAIKK